MPRQTLYLWKQAPFLRLVIPFMVGIVLQWYGGYPPALGWLLCVTGIAALILLNRQATFRQYTFRWVSGVCINLVMLSAGLLIAYYKDVSHQQQWLNRVYHANDIVVARLEEPLSEKANSFKANASVQQLVHNNSNLKAAGNIIIYFRKATHSQQLLQLGYGSVLAFSRPLQPIKNSGNPASFDYERYAAFQGIYQQVFLDPGTYSLLPEKDKDPLTEFVFAAREKVLKIIAGYIPGKKEAGLAEALLVGYKDDLDKSLVQSYSNTGVVHIIAISGMHMGLIYWLLGIVLRPLKKRKQGRWMVAAITIAGLWLFSLMAGGGPSILRSAVMFTCIVIAESTGRRTYIFNSLAASAFILLCINPFWLWDAGFQLSYAAVLSIVIFMKPIYHSLYFKNKLIDNTWKLVAISLAAQVLTTPISIYHFHQFPIYFLFTNLLAVPLSSLIVLLEIGLCTVSFIPAVASFTGVLLYKLISCMNGFIEHMESLPFALLNSLQVNLVQVLFLYVAIAGICYWLMKKNSIGLLAGLAATLAFVMIRSVSFIVAGNQQQLIVYNIPKHSAIGFVGGRNFIFRGDSSIIADPVTERLYLGASCTLLRTSISNNIDNLIPLDNIVVFNDKKIALVNESYQPAGNERMNTDIVIIAGNAPVTITQLQEKFNCTRIVLDASNSLWRVNKWKEEAAKLGLHCFYTVDNGAFVMNMD